MHQNYKKIQYFFNPAAGISAKSIKTAAVYALLCLIVSLTGCATSQKDVKYKNINNIEGSITALRTSRDSIDRGPTYEVFFKLKEAVPCIELSVTSRYLPDSIAPKYNALKTYFILDRIIDISPFKIKNQKFKYTPLAKNFTHTWEYERNITVCTIKNDPLHKIDMDSIYRLRLTTFTTYKFEYTIIIKSDTEVIKIINP